MGWENVFHCECNAFGKQVLTHYWPNAISYDDITTTDFSIHHGNIDILTGGFPCQPFSIPGKRLGTKDARHLWPEMLRAIREIAPRYIVGENVYGLVNWNGGLVFEAVQADLEAEGYEVSPVILPACAVNAPHRRDRIWFVAYRGVERCDHRSDHRKERPLCDHQNGHASEDQSKRSRRRRGTGQAGKVRTATHPNDLQHSGGLDAGADQQETTGSEGGDQPQREASNRQRVWSESGTGGTDAANTNGQNLERNRKKRKNQSRENSKGYFRSCIGTWEQWPTQPPLCSGDDGLSPELDGITFSAWRQASIIAYGNAIVPQVAHQIFKAIQATRSDHTPSNM